MGIYTSIYLFCEVLQNSTFISTNSHITNNTYVYNLLFSFLTTYFLFTFSNIVSSHTYHIHHAIFSGLLSMWFIDWNNTIVMIFHAIMGIEGIDFYGIQELFLFLVNDSPVNQTIITLFLFFIYLYLFCYFIYKF